MKYKESSSENNVNSYSKQEKTTLLQQQAFLCTAYGVSGFNHMCCVVPLRIRVVGGSMVNDVIASSLKSPRQHHTSSEIAHLYVCMHALMCKWKDV